MLFDSALPASLILMLGLNLPCFAQSIKAEKEPPAVTIAAIKRALADAKAKNDLLGPNVLALAPELTNTLTNPATAKECWSCVEQFQQMVNASKQVEDKAYAQALIARFAKVTGREDLAKKDYQASISIMQGAKHEFKFGFDFRDIYINLFYKKISERCKIALALLSCKEKKGPLRSALVCLCTRFKVSLRFSLRWR